MEGAVEYIKYKQYHRSLGLRHYTTSWEMLFVNI